MRWAPLLLVLGAGCDGSAASPQVGDPVARAASQAGITGRYTASDVLETFSPCGLEEVWLPEGPINLLPRYSELGVYALTPVFARVRGKASAPGGYGHFNAFRRTIEVEALLEMRALAPGE